MSLELTGLDNLIANLQRLSTGATKAVAGPLKVETEKVMSDSKENYVPVKDGILRGSGYVADPVIDASGVSVEMGYGGAASDYALVQHERLDFNHPGGKSAKYLERPLMAAERGMADRLATGIMPAIEGLVK